jgi:endonuclease YncB( thermonuclease family)
MTWLGKTFLLCCVLSGAAVSAASIEGLVIGVSDGDTITVLDENRHQHKIRLAGIDAPEKRQDFANRSKQSLSDLVYRLHVIVETGKTDRYGRLVGKVSVDGQDVNLEQVRRGMAWHYKAYEREQLPADRQAYTDAENAARAARRGLWGIPAPTPPWEFRQTKKMPAFQAITAPPTLADRECIQQDSNTSPIAAPKC